MNYGLQSMCHCIFSNSENTSLAETVLECLFAYMAVWVCLGVCVCLSM